MANKHGPSETVEFNGVRYRRYPESKVRSLRVYYTSSVGKFLHRAIWAATYGAIPPKHHVHHRDGDSTNNDISNLSIRLGREHLSEHASEPDRVAESRKNIHRAIAAAPEWHRSPEGIEWHRVHGVAVMAARPLVGLLCVVCDDGFESKDDRAEVCSMRCHAKRRRDSGIDDIDMVCPGCQRTFKRNRYQRPGYCSHACSTRAANHARRANL